jgi:hypothetical protein
MVLTRGARMRHVLGSSVLMLALAAPVADARLNPPPGEVRPGEQLTFTLPLDSPKWQVSTDGRKQCAELNQGPVQYTVTFAVIGAFGVPQRELPPGTFTASVTVPANAKPGGATFVDMYVTGHCGSLGIYSATAQWGPFRIAEAPQPSTTKKSGVAKKPGIQQRPPIAAKGSATAQEHYRAMQECTPPVTVAGRSVRVYVQDPTGAWKTAYSQACADARAVARGEEVLGVACSSPADADYVLCTRRQVTIVGAPYAGPTRCTHVEYNGHRYMVFKQRVTCRYARATALRMLRRESPYIYEFESPEEGKRWSCRILGNGPSERAACYKRVENRWVLYAPVPLDD